MSQQDTTRKRQTAHTPAHGRLGRLTQCLPPGHPDLVAAQREVAELKAERLIRDLVSQAPPISEAARRRLAEILYTAEAQQDGAA